MEQSGSIELSSRRLSWNLHHLELKIFLRQRGQGQDVARENVGLILRVHVLLKYSEQRFDRGAARSGSSPGTVFWFAGSWPCVTARRMTLAHVLARFDWIVGRAIRARTIPIVRGDAKKRAECPHNVVYEAFVKSSALSQACACPNASVCHWSAVRSPRRRVSSTNLRTEVGP